MTVFSEHFQVELDVVDIQTQRIDRFGKNPDILIKGTSSFDKMLSVSFSTGEDKGYRTRAFLLYDGIHYDPIVMTFGNNAPQQGVFSIKDDTLLVEALQIAKEAQKVVSLSVYEFHFPYSPYS